MSLRIYSDDKHKFEATWEIDTASVIGTGGYETPEKVVDGMPDVKWKLKWVKISGYINLWFCVKSKNTVEFTLDPRFSPTLSYDDSGVFKKYCKTEKNLQFHSISTEDFIKAAKNGTFTVKIDACIWYQNKSSNYSLILRELVEDPQELGSRLLENDDLKDFDIHVDEKTIMIHKLIIATESPVFARMFEDNFKEANSMFSFSYLKSLFSTQRKQVTITDFEYEIVQAAVDYCYRQEVSHLIYWDDRLLPLLCFADKYDFQTLKPKLERLCSEKLTRKNVASFAAAAEETNSAQLQKACGDSIRWWKRGQYPAEELAKMDLKALLDALPYIRINDTLIRMD